MLDDLDIKEDPIETIEVSVSDDRDDTREKAKEDDIKDILNDIDTELSNLAIGSDNVAINNEITINNNQEEKETFEDQILDNMSDEKEYSIYRVYTVKEDDTLDIIYDKFNTNKEILSDYNDLDNISVGCKIIIPSSDE